MALRPGPSQALLLALVLVGGGQCESDAAAAVGCAGDELSLSVVSVGNSSGQPVVQARLEQPAGRPPWRLHVRLRELPCGEGGAARRVVEAAVHAPNNASALPTPARLQQHPDPQINNIEVIETATALEVPSFDESQSGQHPRYGGFTKVANIGRYKLHASHANWTRATLACSREGATLAVPNSQREADALWRLKQGGSPASGGNPRARGAFGLALAGMERMSYLVGAHRDSVSQNFTTIFGEPLSDAGFSIWAAASAAESGGDCVAMFSNRGFFAVPCEAELSFICELPL